MGLESVDLVMAWEEHFGIEIPDESAVTMETPRQTIALIAQIIETQGANRVWTPAEIERDVCEIIVEQLGIRRKAFTLDSYYIRDMGVD